MNESKENKVLSKILTEWEVDTDVPTGFAASVWTAIATRRWESLIWIRSKLGQLLVTLNQRPVFAGVFALTVLVLSLVGAQLHARAATNHQFSRGELAYLQIVSPLVRANLGETGVFTEEK